MTYSKYLKPIDEFIHIDEYVQRTNKTVNSLYHTLHKIKRKDPKEYERVREIRNGRIWVNWGRLYGYHSRLLETAQTNYEYLMYETGKYDNDYELATELTKVYDGDAPAARIYRHMRSLYSTAHSTKREGFIRFYDALHRLAEKHKKDENER